MPASATIGKTVTFVANDGQSPVPTAPQSPTLDGSFDLTPFSVLFPTLTYPDHTFDFWSTQPGGGGVIYLDGALYPFLSDATLYAQWIGPSRTVTFIENSTPSDAVETDQVSDFPTSLTLFKGLSTPFSNPNHTFKSWDTSADGSGTNYADGVVFNFATAMELFAQWTPNNETLTFSSNSGSGSVSSLTASYGSSTALPLGGSLAKKGYSFVGWNMMPDGSGTQYKAGANFIVPTSETLYAVWSRDLCLVSFANPGLKGKMIPISVAAGETIHLRSSSKFVKPGYSFVGWFTSSEGGRFVGKSGALFTPERSITLYAHWKGNPFVGLKFSDNGGVGHIPARTVRVGLSVVIPDGSGLHRSGFTFRGWASNPRSPGPTVYVGRRVVLTHSKVLYALWRRALPASTPQVLLGSVGIFASNSSKLTPAMRHYIASLAIGINQHNRTRVLLYGYTTSKDSANGSALLSLQRALAVEKQLNLDLTSLNDVGVRVHAVGEGRLSNSVLASFRNVEVFAN
jgi:uncharacterized repeat protein (TIGR02543 family)